VGSQRTTQFAAAEAGRNKQNGRERAARCEAPVDQGGLTIFITQSGETADTVACLRYTKDNGSKTIGASSMSDLQHRSPHRRRRPNARGPRNRRRLDQSLHLPARGGWPALAISLGKARGMVDEKEEAALVSELVATPGLLAEALKLEPAAERLARSIARARRALSRPRIRPIRWRWKARSSSRN
jgi:glucosamine--fructose-6-phosphate aminotransferase (isomerizing)